MIKKIILFVAGFILTHSCVDFSEKPSILNKKIKIEIREMVKSVTLSAKYLRGNPDNVGGNETSVYEPSSYFNPDPEYVADQRPIWMRSSDAACIFLVAIISSDKGFDSHSWSAFFHGIDQKDQNKVKEYAIDINIKNYKKICDIYSFDNPISFDLYKNKILLLGQPQN
jgi:hypothetical protein